MLRCREVTEVVAQTKHIPIWRKPELWLHLAVCGACRLYAKQMNLLKIGAKKLARRNEDSVAEKKLEEEILKKIKDA